MDDTFAWMQNKCDYEIFLIWFYVFFLDSPHQICIVDVQIL